MPQHNDETSISVMDAKVEKSYWINIRLNPKCYKNGQSAGKPRIGETSTTIPLWE